MNVNRDFKGIWIPKEIWLDDKLTIMEKIFLVEIDSLDNENGCFAGNTYFKDFFKLTKQRCSQIIKSLESKKYVKIQYEREGKEIVKRIIKVSNKFYTYQEKFNKVSNKCEEGIKKTLTGYQENVKENNTYNNTVNNTSNNTDDSEIELAFDRFWNKYDKKVSREKCFNKFKKLKQSEIDTIFNTLDIYIKSTPDKKYRLNPKTYLNNKSWNDEIILKFDENNNQIFQDELTIATPEQYDKLMNTELKRGE